MIGARDYVMRNCYEAKDFALNHIQKKYGESFDIVYFKPKNIDMPYDELVMKDCSGNKFFTYVEKDEDGYDIIRDSYYGVLKADEYNHLARNILNKHFSEYKFFSNFTAGYFDNKYNRDYALSEALKDNKTQFFSYNFIFIPEENLSTVNEAVYKNLVAEFDENNFSMYIAVYPVSDEKYKEIDESKDVNLFLPDDFRVNPIFKKTIK